MARFKPQLPSREFFGGWGFVIVLGIFLTIVVFVSRGGWQTLQSGFSDPGGCRVTVTATTVNVRSGPSTSDPVVGELREGELLPATRNVQNGFRELSIGRWAFTQFLAPLPGSNCI